MEEKQTAEDFPACCEAEAEPVVEPTKKPSRKKVQAKAEPEVESDDEKAELDESETEPAKRYFMRCNLIHGRPSGERLVFNQGDEAKGLSDGEIKTFLENGFIELK